MNSGNDEQSTSFLPHFRVWLCGTFRMERRVGTIYEGIRTPEWGGSSYPRLLLKALLSCPSRHARREALIEMLWPDADSEQAVQYFNTATTKLRKVLQPAKGGESLLMTEDDFTLYRLEDQHLLWVDVDEALALLKEVEHFGRTSLSALRLLEMATTYFNAGTFLPDEEGLWATGKRATIERTRYRCRLWFADVSLLQGLPGQAETVLSSLLEDDPTDEDVLCRLMMLLHQEGMTHQAILLYENARTMFAREDLELTEATRYLSTQLRNHRLPSSLASESRPVAQNSLLQQTRYVVPLLFAPIITPNNSSPHVSVAVTQDILNNASQGNGKVLSTSSFSSVPLDRHQEDRSERMEHDMDKLRRDLLQVGASVTGTLLSSASHNSPYTDLEMVGRIVRALKKPSRVDDLFVAHLIAVTRDHRKGFVLSKNSAYDIHSLRQDTSMHLLTITQLLEHSFPVRMSRQLCTLTGETAQLLGDICFHEGKNDIANLYYDTAIEAAVEAQNEVLHAVILGRKSFVPLYCGDASLALPFLQQAHELASRDASDVIRAWLMVVEAEVQAVIGNAEACDNALKQSEYLLHQSHQGSSTCTFPSEVIYAPLNPQRFLGYMGACYLRLRQPQKAQPILHTYLASASDASLHKKSIILVDLARTYAFQGDLEAMYKYADQAMQALDQTRSMRVLQRMFNLRQELNKWQDTMYVKQLDQRLTTITLSSVM